MTQALFGKPTRNWSTIKGELVSGAWSGIQTLGLVSNLARFPLQVHLAGPWAGCLPYTLKQGWLEIFQLNNFS